MMTTRDAISRVEWLRFGFAHCEREIVLIIRSRLINADFVLNWTILVELVCYPRVRSKVLCLAEIYL